MVCPQCGQRKAKRACPALGQQICAVCCGTKRLVEINCPADCVYLTAARSHPPAVVQRQPERDRAQLLPLLAGLSERQARLFLMLGTLISRHQGEALQTLVDEDIAQATEALAATLETARRGIVYEHRPSTVPAERLLTELKGLVTEVTREGGSALERDAAIALRRLEAAAKERVKAQPGGHAFQQLLIRVLLAPGDPASGEQHKTATTPTSSLIIP
jgi:hypothetical protein